MKSHHHVSDHFMLNMRGHEHFDFVDVDLTKDNKVFIDPALIECNNDSWSVNANRCLQSFMDCMYKAYRDDDHRLQASLFSHAGEQNDLKMGYGQNGRNGHGNTSSGIALKFSGLRAWTKQLGSIHAADLSLLVRDFAEDGMCDLLAHVLAKPLAEFTIEQCKKHNQTNGIIRRRLYYWDADRCRWEEQEFVLPTYNATTLLLVPKQVVRKSNVVTSEHFLRHAILQREKEQTKFVDEYGRVRYGMTKKALEDRIPKEQENWRRVYIENYDNKESIFKQYHSDLPGLCLGKQMSDAELDQLYEN